MILTGDIDNRIIITIEVVNVEKLEEKVYCHTCKNRTNHGIIYTYKEQSEPNDDVHWLMNYHIVQCLGCDDVSFVREYGDEDMWVHQNGNRVWINEFTVYPEEPKKEEVFGIESLNLKPKNFKHVPKNILNLYNQIIESFNNFHFVLCTSGLRTLIEGICTHQNIKKGFMYDEDKNKLPDPKDDIVRKQESLGGKIFELCDRGLIIFHQALILQKIKDIGNAAIHDIETPDMYTINEIIEIAEKVITDIYELRNHKLLQSDN